MAINFPASPSTDDTYTENSISWIFNGTSWNALDEPTTASDIGLGNVDNTSDASKPVSTAQQTAIDAVIPADRFSGGEHLISFDRVRAWAAGNSATNDKPPLNVLVYGDSLSNQLSKQVNAEKLISNMPFRGWKIMPVDRGVKLSGAGTADLDWHAPTYLNWLSGGKIWKLVGPVTMDWDMGAPVVANEIGLAYMRGVGSSTVNLQVSRDGGSSYSTTSAIDTSAATDDFNFFRGSIHLGWAKRCLARVDVPSGHTVYMVAPGLWEGTESPGQNRFGYTVSDMTYGGAILGDSGVDHEEISAAIAPNIVLMCSNEITGYGVGEDMDTMRTAILAGNTNTDFCFVTNQPGGPAFWSGGSGDTVGDKYATQRESIKSWCVRNGESYIDFAAAWGDFDNAVLLGLSDSGDSVHPATYGYDQRQLFVGRVMGDGLAEFSSAQKLLNTDGITPGLEVFDGQTIIKSVNKVPLFDSGTASGWQVNSPDENHALNESLSFNYWGSGVSPRIRYGAKELGSFNFRTILNMEATGTYSGGNMVVSSDWPLVTVLDTANAVPATPAAGKITTYARLNGSSKMEMCMITPSGAIVVLGVEP